MTVSYKRHDPGKLRCLWEQVRLRGQVHTTLQRMDSANPVSNNTAAILYESLSSCNLFLLLVTSSAKHAVRYHVPTAVHLKRRYILGSF
ncbi:hypothetical protein J6590_087919 [Homalodisca vitripennis]|nr:hypothetical protein J6590_080143 [Homalodisca vitripennis]KAG8334543.1 hypothetical protein J6590_087919 [Homalodisca vitripennis]